MTNTKVYVSQGFLHGDGPVRNATVAEQTLADELQALRVERHQLQNDLTAAGLENERLREVLTFPIITPEATSSALFIRTLREHEKGQPVNGQDLINALMWRVRNQRQEIARLQAKRDAVEPNAARLLVAKQAEDEGLWIEAQTVTEAYLQQELRKLHAAVEGTEKKSNACTCGRQATGDHEPGCAYRPDWL